MTVLQNIKVRTPSSEWSEDALAFVVAQAGGRVEIKNSDAIKALAGKTLRLSVNDGGLIGSDDEVAILEVVE